MYYYALNGKDLWLRLGWKILLTRMRYFSNADWDRWLCCEDKDARGPKYEWQPNLKLKFEKFSTGPLIFGSTFTNDRKGVFPRAFHAFYRLEMVFTK